MMKCCELYEQPGSSAEKTVLKEAASIADFRLPTCTEIKLLHKANLEHMGGQSF